MHYDLRITLEQNWIQKAVGLMQLLDYKKNKI